MLAKRMLLISFIVVLGLMVAPLSAQEAVYFPTTEWRVSTPEAQGMDSAELANLLAQFSQPPHHPHSIMVINHLLASNAPLTPDRERWPLAGDQLFLDLDLSAENLPIGQRLAIGEVILEVSPQPHNGCAKFTERFGSVATHFINSPEGRQHRLRGVNTRIIRGGVVRLGDRVTKIATDG